jgi:restriction system protein
MWMVKSEAGEIFAPFRDRSLIAIGWPYLGNLNQYQDIDQLRVALRVAEPEAPPGRIANAAAMIQKFKSRMKIGDGVITFDPVSRNYLVGRIASEYTYDAAVLDPLHPHVRRVEWTNRLSRDRLSASSRNSLGSALTLFSVNDDVRDEIFERLGADAHHQPPEQSEGVGLDVEEVQADEVAKAFELVKDSIIALTPRDLEELAAAVFRAMGYRARVAPIGADRGVDVYASPDGLMLEAPRIKAQVKHRPGSVISAPDIRGFSGTLREGDRGVFISTGGFSRDARYEADRSQIPVSLVDLNDLAQLVIDRYEQFNVDGRMILPLVRIYIPER